MKKYGLRKLLMAVCLAVLCLGMTTFAAEDTILKGVMIDEVDVSGMTKSEALKALASYEKSLGEQTLTLGNGNRVEKKGIQCLAGGGTVPIHTTYQYDIRGQLLEENHEEEPAGVVFRYGYDACGNRIEKKENSR